MTIAPALSQPRSVTSIHCAEDLQAFRDPSCAAAVWERSLSPALKRWLDSLDPANLPRWREIVAVDAVQEVVVDACEEAGTPDGPERRELIADIQSLADAFAGMMQTTHLQVRLEVITSNACRRFHVDAVTGRMVCTYRGTGTQYGVGREKVDPEDIRTVNQGEPIFLRGTLWPSTPASGLLHRSPPIAGTGETRLVLVLDPIFDPEDED